MILCRLDDFAHTFGRPNVTRIDPQARRTGFGSFNRTFVMEMDVGHDRDIDLFDNVLKRERGFLIRAGHTHDVCTGFFQTMDLRNCRVHIGGQGVCHRLHRDRCVAADFHIPDKDFAAFAAFNIAIWADAHFRFQNVQGVLGCI